MGKKLPFVGVIRAGVTKEYFIPSHLPLPEKKAIALSIFMDVTYGFEKFQGTFPWSIRTAQSRFSEED